MSWLFFAIGTAILWGTAELFYKKGAQPQEKYSHLKICIWVGIVMGAHAIFTLLTQNINYNPINLICYLPVSLFYIISMAFSYFGMRFLEESISDPIENTAGVICVLLFALFMGDEFSWLTWVAVAVIGVGVVGVSYLENRGETPRKKNFGKLLAVVAFIMPFLYALLDAFGTFLDDAFFLIEDVASSPLVDVTEDTIEAVANTSYELTFALFALGLFIFMKVKKVRFGPSSPRTKRAKSALLPPIGTSCWLPCLRPPVSLLMCTPWAVWTPLLRPFCPLCASFHCCCPGSS